MVGLSEAVRLRIPVKHQPDGDFVSAEPGKGEVDQGVEHGEAVAHAYEVRGLPEKITGYDHATVGSGNVVNEVSPEYHDVGQLVADYQEHGVAVNTSTSPKVGYAYTDGSAGHARRRKTWMP